MADNNQFIKNVSNDDAADPSSLHQYEIDLKQISLLLWRGKWVIIGITFLFSVIALLIALYLPNEYRASAIVVPTEKRSSANLGAIANQFSGLASLTGVEFGAKDSSDAALAMAIIETWGFAETFIEKHGVQASLFASTGWDPVDNTITFDPELYNKVNQSWIYKSANSKVGPSSWELYKEYKKSISVSQNNDNTLINISATHYSPEFSKKLVDWLVSDINQHMKESALKLANKNIEYLQQQMSQTSVAEIRNMFSQLIQEQYKTKMLAQVSDEYVFKTISPAKIPEERVKPNRSLIVLIGFIFGLLVSSLFVFFNKKYHI